MSLTEDWSEPDLFESDLISDIKETGYENFFDSGNDIEEDMSAGVDHTGVSPHSVYVSGVSGRMTPIQSKTLSDSALYR